MNLSRHYRIADDSIDNNYLQERVATHSLQTMHNSLPCGWVIIAFTVISVISKETFLNIPKNKKFVLERRTKLKGALYIW